MNPLALAQFIPLVTSVSCFVCICLFVALTPTIAFGQDIVTKAEHELAPHPQNAVQNSLCIGCESAIPPRFSRGLMVVADFQPGPTEPCAPEKTTIAGVQQWGTV